MGNTLLKMNNRAGYTNRALGVRKKGEGGREMGGGWGRGEGRWEGEEEGRGGEGDRKGSGRGGEGEEGWAMGE